jgi:hypothetical protein
MTKLLEILPDPSDCAIVYGFALREQKQLIKQLERGCGWLMDASYDEQLQSISNSEFCSHWHGRTLCFVAIFFTNDITSNAAAESSPDVGSSRNMIFGLVMSWLATLTRLFCPPLRPFLIGVPINVVACLCKPNAESRASMRLIRSALLTVLYRK